MRGYFSLVRPINLVPLFLATVKRRCLCSVNGVHARIPIPRHDWSVCPDVARANHVITRLCREGNIIEAHKLFDDMPLRDVISWTTLISGYIRCGMLREAQFLFNRSDSKKDVVTCTALLSGYIRSKNIKEAEDLFAKIPDKHIVTWNTMVLGYIEHGFIDKACLLFGKMPERNTVSYNTMLTGLIKADRVEQACDLFNQMPAKDIISRTTIITGLAQNGQVDRAREVFDEMPERNVISWNAMISCYAQNGLVSEAFEIFNKMPFKDISSWNGIIACLVRNKMLDRAKELFDEMPERNVVSWTCMISGYKQMGMNEMALRLFCSMLYGVVRPNQGTFVCVLDAISNLPALFEGLQVHQLVIKTRFESDSFVRSALMNVYSKCGEIGIARKVFDLSPQRDLVSWNGIISAYAHNGNGREAINLYEEMQKQGFKPNDVTYVGLLSACSHSGLVDEGLDIFTKMVRDKFIVVREEHYACLIDLCGRSGRLEEVKKLINGLKNGSLSSFNIGAFLNGFNLHSKREKENFVENKLLEMEPDNAGTYTLLSNIYASAGKFKEAVKIRARMKDRGLRKQPGCSWIEVGNRVHVFVVRDKSHSETKSIYGLIHDIHGVMRMNGHDHDNLVESFKI